MRRSLFFSAVLLALTTARHAEAGGGPMNVMVVYSADDAKATAVAKHYEAARSLPVGHLCGIAGVTPAQTTIDAPTYASLIQTPLDACLAALPQPDEIDYLVLVRGLPYSVTLPSYAASLEAVMQVHHAKKVADGTEIAGAGQPDTQPSVPNPTFPQGQYGVPSDYVLQNQYMSWYSSSSTILRAKQQPASFHRAAAGKSGGYDFAKNLFIVSSLDGFDYDDATALVDRGVACDGTLPKAELLCMHAEDDARGARDPECELATRMLTMAGFAGTFVDPFDASLAGHSVAAYFTGSADSERTAIAGNTFVPGAITDNLTSYGAAIANFACSADGTVCPAAEVQTSIARFVRAGATGAHGTVNEPFNNPFPNAGALLHYTFGYSMGEAYLFNQRYLYWQNVHLGDPLATPYAVRPKVAIDGAPQHPKNAPIVVHATHADGVASVDLFVAGKRVASATGDTVSYDVTEGVGEKLELLAIAVAKNAPVTRAGWIEVAQAPRADVQGWTTASLTIAPASQGAGGAGGGGGAGGAGGSAGAGVGGAAPSEEGKPASPDAASGCGCRTVRGGEAGLPALGASLLLVVAAARRKRRLDAKRV